MEVEGKGKSEVVRWERFLPRVSLRVLLVEGDDSTRQIIAALLHKCSYKVSSASDGSKAWETLKDKSHNIDLILMEVELPSISGFDLLSMIMNHETCKGIPVIMMSSHDSIGMVFKGMSKGASDFLVKPIRKNELRNLWQHVWRHISSVRHDGTSEHQNGSLAKKQLGKHSIEYVAHMQENKEASEKGSDAQSSCTRSDMETESLYMQTVLDPQQPNNKIIFFMDENVDQNHHDCIEKDCPSLMNAGEAEDKSVMLDSQVTPFNGMCNSNEQTLDKDRNYAVIRTMDEDEPSQEVIDLIGAIDSQPQCSFVPRNASESLILEKNAKWNSSSMPYLELSLRRYQQNISDKTENDDSNTLNHSNSSAFSLYNSSIAAPTFLSPLTSGTEQHYTTTTTTTAKLLPDQCPSIASNALCHTGARTNTNGEDTTLGLVLIGGVSAQCSPLQAIPFPISTKEMSFDNLSAGFDTVTQPIYYPRAVHPLWTRQKAVYTNSLHHSDPPVINPPQSHHPDDRSPESVIYHPTNKKQEENKERGNKQEHLPSVTVESESSSICHVSRDLNISGSGSFCDRSTESNTTAADIYKANIESGNDEGLLAREGIKGMESHRFNQREAALNKFRLKRKDRCYEKKVRYQSRKRLAEQRPRVKGQFARQVQSDSRSNESACYHYNLAA